MSHSFEKSKILYGDGCSKRMKLHSLHSRVDKASIWVQESVVVLVISSMSLIFPFYSIWHQIHQKKEHDTLSISRGSKYVIHVTLHKHFSTSKLSYSLFSKPTHKKGTRLLTSASRETSSTTYIRIGGKRVQKQKISKYLNMLKQTCWVDEKNVFGDFQNLYLLLWWLFGFVPTGSQHDSNSSNILR
jgi:hypothetical protein